MEPLTVLSLIGTVTKLATIVSDSSISLYKIVSDIRRVDDDLNALFLELRSLSRMISAVENHLQDPAVKQHEKLSLWADVDASLQACIQTVNGLSNILKSFETQKRGAGLTFNNTVRSIKLNFKNEDIARVRTRIQTHNSSMQLLLLMVNIHIATTTPSIVMQDIGPKLDSLIGLLQQQKRESKDSLREVGIEPATWQSRARLVACAEEIISKASTIIGPRSTVWDGSEVDLILNDIPHSLMEISADIQTMGSETGEKLRKTKMNYIYMWIPEVYDTINEDPHVTFEHDIDDFSDEYDLEADLTLAYFQQGKQRIAEGAFDDAESFLSRSLETYNKISGKWRNVLDVRDIQMDFAITKLHLDKLDQAEELCQIVMNSSFMSCDSDRVRVLDATFVLSQVYLAENSLEDARRACDQTLRGRLRLNGKTQAYFETVALMMAISEAVNDFFTVSAYQTFLPSGFEMPKFKRSETTPLNFSEPHLINGSSTSKENTTVFSSSPAENVTPNDPFKLASVAVVLKPPVVAKVSEPLTDSIEPVQEPIDQTVPSLGCATSFGKHMFSRLSEQEKENALQRLELAGLCNMESGKFDADEALYWAADCGDVDIVTMLTHGRGAEMVHPCFTAQISGVDALKDFDYKRKMTPLSVACFRGHATVVKLLLAAGASVDGVDAMYDSPLHMAVFQGYENCARHLLDAGANVNWRDPKGQTPLHKLFIQRRYNSGDRLSLLRLLLSHGANVDAVDQCGYTRLMDLARGRKYSPKLGTLYFEMLLAFNPKLDVKDNAGWTALCWALCRRWDEAAVLLRSKGAACPHGEDFQHLFPSYMIGSV